MKTITDSDVKFLLKDPRADRATLIYLVYRFNSGRFKYSTEQTIEPYQWDSTNQRAYVNQKSRADRETYQTINARIDRHRAAFKTVLTRLQLANAPLDNDLLKQNLNAEMGRVKKVKPEVVVKVDREPFTAFIERFVSMAEDGKRLNAKNARYSRYTLASYRVLKGLLIEFQATTGNSIDYDAFSLAFYNSFKIWLTNRGLSLNYVGCLLKNLKILLKQSYADGLHTNTVFQHRDFKKFSEDVDSVYLSDDELRALFTLDLTSTPGLDRARDMFLIGCYTGLRFSDFSELRPENITHNGRTLTCRTQKTAERVVIPLNYQVRAILEKYHGVPPKPISNQRLNDHLKELGKKAGLINRVEITRTEGGSRKTRYTRKWELIGTHTARRSFATNAYLAKVDPVQIMKITGHRSEKMLLRYIKISSEQNALLMLEHPHFNQPTTNEQM